MVSPIEAAAQASALTTIANYAIPLGGFFLAVCTLILGWFALRNKAEDREVQLIHTTIDTRLKIMDQQILTLTEQERECQKERRQLLADNYQLMRDLMEARNPASRTMGAGGRP